MAEAMLRCKNTTKRISLTAAEVLHYLKYPEETVSTIPFRPKGGSIYIFRPDHPSKINDWKADGHS